MSVDIRLPNIASGSVEEQISDIRTYLFQMVQELNWALNTAVGNDGSVTYQEEQPYKTFSSIKAMIMRSADIVNAYYSAMKKKFDLAYALLGEYQMLSVLTQRELSTLGDWSRVISLNEYELKKELERINDGISYKDGYIRITDNGIDIGMDTGDGFRKYARFDGGKISFYVPGIGEAAYFQGNALHVKNLDVEQTVKISGYEIDGSNGLTFRWIGGDR